MKVLLAIGALLLVVLAVKGGGSAGHTTPTGAGTAGTATVTGTESSGDKTKGLTHYADCRASDGSEFRVVVTADVDYALHSGQPCPAGPHVPTVRQENPGLYDQISNALTAPLPYNGGDANGPCGSRGAADTADADQMQAQYQQCMASHGVGTK